MLSIPMGGANVVLGLQWLRSLGTVAFNLQEIFLIFFFGRKGNQITGYHKEATKDTKL